MQEAIVEMDSINRFKNTKMFMKTGPEKEKGKMKDHTP